MCRVIRAASMPTATVICLLNIYRISISRAFTQNLTNIIRQNCRRAASNFAGRVVFEIAAHRSSVQRSSFVGDVKVELYIRVLRKYSSQIVIVYLVSIVWNTLKMNMSQKIGKIGHFLKCQTIFEKVD